MATHAYGGCSSAQHHAGKANVLGYHHIAGLQALDDGEVRSVCPNADVKGLYPKAAACGRGVARVVAANAALKVLGAIARDYGVDSSASGNIECFARDGAGVGVDKQRGRGHGCGCWHGLYGRVLYWIAGGYNGEQMRTTCKGDAMSILYALAGLLIIAAVVSLVLSLLGVIVVGALRVLPVVFVILAAVFFLSGGRVDVHLPDSWRKK